MNHYNELFDLSADILGEWKLKETMSDYPKARIRVVFSGASMLDSHILTNHDQNPPALSELCGRFLTYRDLIECGETQEHTGISNLPNQYDSYTALLELATELLDPIIDNFGKIKLTYGFCSAELSQKITGRIAPKLDQHAARERNRRGNHICDRGGAAADFLVESIDMISVSCWIAENLPFDRMYIYGPDRPVHLSYAECPKRQVTLMKAYGSENKLIPRTMSAEKFRAILSPNNRLF
ncbi:hypothetical protein [Marinobacter sp.]|uniref:hypothetical protein n=1 Tax=Marinobacter sp. TaxID=50741 RepID=UPI00384FC2FC